MYDVVIIGAGVVGAAIARELSRYELEICVLEKECDVATGASKANSGIVHGGYAAKYGTLKGQLCGLGNMMYKNLDDKLHFGYRQTGALVIGFNEEDKKRIIALYENGLRVACDDLEVISGEKLKEIEPYLSNEVRVALYIKNVGVTSPYEFTIALVENAIANGVELKLLNEVMSIEKLEQKFILHTNKGTVEGRYIINAAGLYSDKVSSMAGVDDFKIIPKRGQYILMGKDQGHLVNTVIFQVPTKEGKGILVTTTYHGNFMIGPSAEEVKDKEEADTTAETLKYVVETARKSISVFNIKKALTTFSGIRPTTTSGDFIIEESKVNRFINVAGIDSPGLTASPAIAEMVVGILKKSGLKFEEKENFKPSRKGMVVKKDTNFTGKVDDEDPAKNIICRCEQVTESEIIDAIHRSIPINSTDAVKRRTRAGMGFCQGGFCESRVKHIIARELHVEEDKITVRGESASRSPVKAEINLIRKFN